MFTDGSLDWVWRGSLLTLAAMVWLVVLVRVNGLRSFSKMTNFDFVTTVAFGSLLAGAGRSTGWEGFAQTMVAMAALLIVQYGTARLRKTATGFERLIQNQPIVLMRDGEIIEEALLETRVAEDDLIAKLREANVLRFSRVRAAILETTGDISVLHGDDCAEELLQGTRRIDR